MGPQRAASHNPGSGSSGNFPPPSAEVRRALSAWTRAKEALRQSMRQEDFQAFVRPMYLIGLLSGKFLLIALPPSRRVVERARNFRENLRAAIAEQGYDFAGFTPYPSDDVVLLLIENNASFGPFAEMICRGRLKRLEARRAAENARDRTVLE